MWYMEIGAWSAENIQQDCCPQHCLANWEENELYSVPLPDDSFVLPHCGPHKLSECGASGNGAVTALVEDLLQACVSPKQPFTS